MYLFFQQKIQFQWGVPWLGSLTLLRREMFHLKLVFWEEWRFRPVPMFIVNKIFLTFLFVILTKKRWGLMKHTACLLIIWDVPSIFTVRFVFIIKESIVRYVLNYLDNKNVLVENHTLKLIKPHTLRFSYCLIICLHK